MSRTLVTRMLLEDSRFNQGINSARRRLQELEQQGKKSSFTVTELRKNLIALGSAVTLAGITNSIREISKLQTSLRNVSGSVQQFNQNMNYLSDVSRKYGSNLNTLIGQYSKFLAAAKTTTMSMVDQKNIFESVVQASTAMGLSTDQLEGALLAVTQMMSKGTVQAEELRGQLGERIPGAFGLAAKAMGVTEAKLGDLLKQGKVMASDLLPKLANELKNTFGNYDATSLEGSINRMSNAWQGLLSNDTIQGFAKTLADAIASALEGVVKNIGNVVAGIAGGLAMLVTQPLSAWSAKAKAMDNMVQSYHTELSNIRVTPMVTNGYSDSQLRQLADADRRLMRIANSTDTYYKKLDRIGNVVGGLRTSEDRNISRAVDGYVRQYNRLNDEVSKMEVNSSKFRSNLLKVKGGTDEMTRGMSGFGRTARYSLNLLKNFGATMWFTALIGALVFIGTKIYEWHKHLNKVKDLVKDINKNIAQTEGLYSKNGSYYKNLNKELETQKKIVLDTTQNIKERQAAYKNLTGYQGDISSITEDMLRDEGAINKKIEERLKLLKDEALLKVKADAYAKLQNEKDKEVAEYESDPTIKKKRDKRAEHQAFIKEERAKNNPDKMLIQEKESYIANIDKSLKKREDAYNKRMKEYDDAMKPFEDAMNQIEERRIKSENSRLTGTSDSDAFSQTVTKYGKDLKELQNQLANGVITIKEYRENLRNLNQSTAESVSKLDKGTKGLKEFLDTLNPRKLSEFAKTTQEYKEDLEHLTKKLRVGAIEYDDYVEAVKGTTQSYVDAALKMGIYNEEIANCVKMLKTLSEESNKIVLPDAPERLEYVSKNEGTRNKTFDYKLGEKEIALLDVQFDLNKAKKELDDMKQAIENGYEINPLDLKAQIELVNSLENKNNIAEITNDIYEKTKERSKLAYDGVKSLSNAFTNLYQNVNSLKNSDGIDAIIGWISVIFSTIDGVLSMIETLNQLAKIKNIVQGATSALSAAEVTGSAAVTSATIVETGAKLALAKVNEYVAVTGAAASVASIPYIGPVLATAAATEMKALLTGLQAFANGGIVGGSSFYGDNVLARVNSGEMILNKGQQSQLFSLLNGTGSGSTSSSGVYELRVSGTNITGAVTNLSNKKKKLL